MRCHGSARFTPIIDNFDKTNADKVAATKNYEYGKYDGSKAL